MWLDKKLGKNFFEKKIENKFTFETIVFFPLKFPFFFAKRIRVLI